MDVSRFDKNDFFFLNHIIDLCGKSIKAEHLMLLCQHVVLPQYFILLSDLQLMKLTTSTQK